MEHFAIRFCHKCIATVNGHCLFYPCIFPTADIIVTLSFRHQLYLSFAFQINTKNILVCIYIVIEIGYTGTHTYRLNSFSHFGNWTMNGMSLSSIPRWNIICTFTHFIDSFSIHQQNVRIANCRLRLISKVVDTVILIGVIGMHILHHSYTRAQPKHTCIISIPFSAIIEYLFISICNFFFIT